MTKRAGGKGANQAYALAKAGGNVTLDGHVGKDGVWVKEMLKDSGVDVSRVGVLDDEVSDCYRLKKRDELSGSGDWSSAYSTSCRW